jgi:hypothetical protein
MLYVSLISALQAIFLQSDFRVVFLHWRLELCRSINFQLYLNFYVKVHMSHSTGTILIGP